ncbi:hypothetical protein [Staphylococcus coagulans]|uniref:hypothetical protein n=1 Tax=Staphylococcus coagulans TaxID=74706 RepID=UPI0030EC3CF3
MTNQEVFEVFEEVIYELAHMTQEIDNKADRFVIIKAINLIDSVAWKYEEDE